MTKHRSLNVGLVFDDSLDTNDGVAQYVKLLGGWLSRRGHRVSYLVGQSNTRTWSGGRVYSLSRNLRVRFNGNRLSTPLPARRVAVKRLLKEQDFDVLHVMVPYSPFMAQVVINRVGPRTVVVGTFHIFPSGRLASLGARLLRLMYGHSLKKFAAIISVSAAAADFARSAFKIYSQVVPNPVDTTKLINAQPASRHQSHKIVFLGRLVERKGCHYLLKAFARLAKDVPGARLVIAGDGPQRPKLQRYVQRLNIVDKVEFLGFVKETDKPALLASADIACFPSLYGESFGIVLVEAMAAGAGVVLGGDNPGYRSVLGDQPKLLVDPKDTATFAERLSELLFDKKLKKSLNDWQRQQVKRYDINIIGQQIEKIYYDSIARLDKKVDNKANAK